MGNVLKTIIIVLGILISYVILWLICGLTLFPWFVNTFGVKPPKSMGDLEFYYLVFFGVWCSIEWLGGIIYWKIIKDRTLKEMIKKKRKQLFWILLIIGLVNGVFIISIGLYGLGQIGIKFSGILFVMGLALIYDLFKIILAIGLWIKDKKFEEIMIELKYGLFFIPPGPA